ncbi:MAG: aminotransferase class V-fold PLP-dependent enzyme [Chloroflexota bacterium]|nr:aminotransferase class V-fold PLP-dependent enzyme [Chloroflexota bacterium]
MAKVRAASVYEEIGVKRVVNAAGHMTILGGSIVSPRVQAAMDEANVHFVGMEELLEKSGVAIAEMLGSEAALVTSGAAAALVQGSSALMAGKDPAKITRLPDTTGMKNEFLIQKVTRYHYDRMVTVPGARLIEVGTNKGTTARELEAAIGPRTAGILYFAHMEGEEGVLSIPQVVEIAHKRGIAVLVDAAGEVYPLDRMRWIPSVSGADLVCFGAKYVGAPHSTGILCGVRELVEAATLSGFIAYEIKDNRAVGRAMKVDRQEVVAVVVALREWLNMNHETRLLKGAARVDVIVRGLTGVPHVVTEREKVHRGPGVHVKVIVDEAGLGKKAADVAKALADGDPAIWVWCEGNILHIGVSNLLEGEDKLVADRLREEFAR